MSMTDKKLLETAAEAMENSYAPYSLANIGAALECEDGTIFTGSLVENKTSCNTVCAETSAICAAVSKGHRTFKRIAVISEGSDYLYPCGTCRQILSEFSPEIEVLCARTSDGRFVSHSLTTLLPSPAKK